VLAARIKGLIADSSEAHQPSKTRLLGRPVGCLARQIVFVTIRFDGSALSVLSPNWSFERIE